MLVIAALLGHALLLGGPATRLLARARWTSRFPQAALHAWHTCAAGLLVSLTVALVLTAHDLWEHIMVWVFHADMHQVHDAYGGAWQATGIAEAALLALALGAGTLSALTLRRSLRLRHDRDRYRLTADAQAGHGPYGLYGPYGAYGPYGGQGESPLPPAAPAGRTAGPPVRVLRHHAPAAFCIPGSPRDSRIVVTSAALELLSGAELAATLEHERAHLRLRHHRSILAADILTAALGWTGLLRGYAGQVRRLAEMAADDQAAHRHGRRTVAKALLEMSSAPGVNGGLGGGLPALTGADPAGRIRRLISAAPRRTSRPVAALIVSAALAATVLPVGVAIAPAARLADTAHPVSTGH
ncbi:M56 family metallopeptidase [Streptomyces sp. NPDC056716]|uniref:M56 family metallopeptidase n=1 Tax=unclassified Streptomyces TaxID=2593676 RepID=UPI00369AE9AE